MRGASSIRRSAPAGAGERGWKGEPPLRFWGLCDPGGGATGDGREGGRMGREGSWGNLRPGQVRRGVEGHRRGKDRRTGVYLPDSWVIAEKVGLRPTLE